MLLDSINERQWFVMRDLRRPNAKVTAYHLLLQNNMEVFTPMTLQNNPKTNQREFVPILKWLLFVYATKPEIDELIDPAHPKIPHLQYILERGKSSRFGGMTVKDSTMNYFRIALAKQEIPIIYRYCDITPEMRGQRVMVTRGNLIGYQGCVQNFTSNKKNLQLLVELDGYCLAPVHISPKDVIFLDQKSDKMTPEQERIHYTRLSRLVDIINYLRFTIPQNLKALSDEQLEQVHTAYCMANQTFDKHHTREYLCIDETCKDRLAAIDSEIALRQKQQPSPLPSNKKLHSPHTLPWVENMTRLCRIVDEIK